MCGRLERGGGCAAGAQLCDERLDGRDLGQGPEQLPGVPARTGHCAAGAVGAWVFIDEHERSINDGWFAVDMEGRRGLLDAPAVRHGGAFGLSFADGHVEVWPVRDGRTLRWASLPIPNTPPNPDWERLAAATTSLK